MVKLSTIFWNALNLTNLRWQRRIRCTFSYLPLLLVHSVHNCCLCWWKGPVTHYLLRSPFYLFLKTEASISQSAVKERVNMDHFLTGVFQRHTTVKEQERRHSLDSFFSYFTPLLASGYKKQIPGTLPEQDCAVILTVKLLKRKDKTVYSTTFPNQTNSSWFLKQEICHKFLFSHWQFSHGYKIVCKSKIKLKGQNEKIIYYLHERILKSSSKEN